MSATKCVPDRNRATLVGAVHLFLINQQHEVLLLRRANTGYDDGSYSVPAGHIEPGESATDAAIREAKEEIGVTINPFALNLAHVMHRRSVSTDCTNSERIDFFFKVAWYDAEPTNQEPSKCDELRWTSLHDLPKNVVPYVRQALECCRVRVPYSEMGWEVPCPACGAGGTVPS